MSTLNRIANCDNRFQNTSAFKRVLCVCSAGLLRSPTAAVVLSQDPFNFNTRAVGVSQEYALTPLEDVHIMWSDEIVVMQKEHADIVHAFLEAMGVKRPVIVLGIEDNYQYRDPDLMKQISEKYTLRTGHDRQ